MFLISHKIYIAYFILLIMENKKSKSRSDIAGGLLFVGALIIGIALGIFYRNTAVGTLIGLGVGFVLFGLIKVLMKE